MGTHAAPVLKTGGREGPCYIYPSTFRTGSKWTLGPQHLLPAPLFRTGRSLEASWSHFRGRVSARLSAHRGSQWSTTVFNPTQTPGNEESALSSAVPPDGNCTTSLGFRPLPNHGVPDTGWPGFGLCFLPSLLVPTQPPSKSLHFSLHSPTALPARARGPPQRQGFFSPCQGPGAQQKQLPGRQVHSSLRSQGAIQAGVGVGNAAPSVIGGAG